MQKVINARTVRESGLQDEQLENIYCFEHSTSASLAASAASLDNVRWRCLVREAAVAEDLIRDLKANFGSFGGASGQE